MTSTTPDHPTDESVSHSSPRDATVALEDLLPIQDLSEQVRALPPLGPSPFDGDPAFPPFFDELCRALHRSSPRHVLLVRERGVGEQAVLVELARRAADASVRFLRDSQVLSGECRRLPVEASRAVIDALFASVAVRESTILCLNGMAALLRSGGDARAALLWHLGRARSRVIGILSPHEYETHFLDDAESHDLFTVVHLQEPETPAAIKLTRHYASGLEVRYRLKIEDEAVRRAVVLSGSYVPHERLPHKAVKVLRAVCDDVEYERTQMGADRDRVTDADVVAKIAQISGVPAQTLSGVGEGVDYAGGLREIVVGQDHAVAEVATELGLIKAGLVDSGKPASVMMFVGQTGTGKTELAKALARFYSPSKRLKTFTLGNFSEPHSVSGIIGVPPGYVGHDQGGRLVNELNADPYSVFLLDEADKAHPDVMQPFLNLFDEGWVYDQRGVKAYADRAIFILTTNVGQRQIGEMCKQGKGVDEITAAMKESLSKIRHTKSNRPVFTAEFLARVKRVIVFKSLDEGAMIGICRRLVADMANDWLAKRQKQLRVDDALLPPLAAKAYALDQKSQGKEGGRIVRKLLSDLVESPIQSAIGGDPDGYRRCATVSVEYRPAVAPENVVPAGGVPAIPEVLREHIAVRFCAPAAARDPAEPPLAAG